MPKHTIGGVKVKIRRKPPKPYQPVEFTRYRPKITVPLSQETADPDFLPPKEKYNKIKATVRKKDQQQVLMGSVDDSLNAFSTRDISLLPAYTNYKPLSLDQINWERRLACKADPLLDLKTYMPKVFYLGFADFHLDLIRNIEDRMSSGGNKAIAFPRGGGKTAVCRGMLLRATKYGMRHFCFFIGAKEDKAIQTLNFLKRFWHRSPELQQDFPEIAYPIHRLEGRGSVGSSGQLYKGERTYIGWGANEVTYPTMLFTEQDIQGYLQHDPSCVKYIPQFNRWIINSAGTVIRVSGIDGSIRGEADTHPILLSQPRPDMVLLDDVQKDITAHSLSSCETLERLIEAAVSNLAAPDVHLTCLMPCTVIREGDVSDTYLSPDKKPEWAGERHGLVKKFPDCMDYDNIYEEIDEKPCEQGKLWLEYAEIRKKSYREHGNLKTANAFYRLHRTELETGFEISWAERYKRNDPR